MNALINKNLLYMRRHLCSTIMNLLVPIIIALLVYAFGSIIDRYMHPMIGRHEHSTVTFDPFVYRKGVEYDFIGIISSESTTTFEKFASLKEFCKKEICSFKRYPSIEDFNVAVRNFSAPELAFHLDKEGDKDRIRVLSKVNKEGYESIHSSINLLSIDDNTNFEPPFSWINIQTFIAEYTTSLSTESLEGRIRINKRPLYSPPKYSYLVGEDLITVCPIMLTFMFISLVSYYLTQIMHEKETKLTDLLFRQGISIYSYWLSWLLSYFLFSIIPIIITSIILAVGIFPNISFFIVFISLLLFAFNLFGYIFLFQACFKSAKTAQMLSNVVYFLVLIVSYLIAQPDMSRIAKYIFMVFPQFIQIVNLEILLLLSNMRSSSWTLINTTYNHVSLFAVFLMYIFNFVVYIGLGWIIMRIKESGIEKLFQCKKKQEQLPNDPLLPGKDFDDYSAPRLEVNHEEIINPVLLGQKKNHQLLSINEATKTYEEVQAVRKFTGDIYNNQIFCLLGHNGAGKTTLIKMISGLEDPDDGDIMLDGRSLIRDKDYLYKNIGLCEQEDLFFDYMTVNENLELMCKLKGEQANTQEIMDLLAKIQLIDKKEDIAQTLSGGQKRKLCIALALIGRSKLVLLDEPTSGMDVIAKRFLWDFLKGYKDNKIIILTTHSLDEAEYLGDRIGIMSEGQYICSGTSSFLKNKYSCGYNINFLGDSSKFTKDIKLQFVQELKKIDPTSIIKSLSKEVLSINFLNINENTNKVFDQIDMIKHSYFIENYTVSTTSLEDVFLKLNSSELSKDLFKDTASQNDVPIEINPVLDSLYVTSGLCSQLCNNIKRTILPLWRNKSSFLPELFVSLAIFAIFYILFNQSTDKASSYQNINSVLSKHTIYYYSLVPETTFNINDLKNNHILANGITFEQLPESVNITRTTTPDEIAANLYKWSTYKYERGVIVITQSDDGKLTFNIFYRMSGKNYFLALTNLITSHFLTKATKKEYLLLSENAKISSTSELLQKARDYGMMITSALILWFSFVNFGGYMVETPVKDRVSNLKHLLFLSGANMIYYWFSHVVVDFLKYCIFLLIILPFLLVSDSINRAYIFIAFGYIFASNLMMYCFSFFLNKAENGRQIYLIVMIVGSIALPIRLIYRVATTLTDFVSLFDFLLGFKFYEVDILPASSFLFGMIRLSVLKMFWMPDKTIYTQGGYIFLVFLIQMVFFSVILFLLEIRVLQKVIHWIVGFFVKDSVRQEEQQRIAQQGSQPVFNQQSPQEYYKKEEMNKANAIDTTTAIRGISKTFCTCLCNKNKAVNNLYMGLKANEKFGLLGFNGSGKTTTFKAITQDLFFDSGTISLFGFDIQTQFNNIRAFIGYCPQENALFDYLTVKETLHYFKTLKKIRLNEEDICQQFGLAKYINAYCKNLSGGNKRKLCFAIALMSHPKLLLLDEPSTGVDPESRRVMWKNINDISKHRAEYNMILSTHSMEEAEILCDTVGWLKKGSFLCVGNPEKLKLQFSNGYRFHVKCNLPAEVGFKEAELNNLNSTLPNPQILNTYTHPEYRAHFAKIDSVIGTIIPYCSSIRMLALNQDKSIDFNIQLKPDCQGKLFSLILTYTKTDKEISEITIDMQSLEKIMTSFEGPEGDPDSLRN